ncbi:HdeD family acid-resistance protein [Neochlamydia sp. EPS4]|uniref:HdeD family acid-resistance protein n=1 Tax=Neochlamydia sp. EPS4 TaxID=1478175 RepID=UPI00138DDC09|nr:DUF308 domain-containing protein [Neochlamydia sp. EPS4]
MNILQKYRIAFIVESILLIILGGIAITAPFIATLSIELMVGSIILLGGGAQLYKSFKAIHEPGGALSLACAIISMLVGACMLIYPMAGMQTLTLLTALFFLVEGIIKISISLEIKGTPNWGWLLSSGIIALLMSGIILSGWPETSRWIIGPLVGINMTWFGFSLLALAIHIPTTK